jgi:signal transduction histidine kinase
VGRTLTATLDPWEVVTRLLHAATEAIDARAGSVWLWDKEQPGWLVCNAAFDHGEGLPLVNLRLAPGKGIVGWVARHRESVITNRVSEDARFTSEIDTEIGFETVSLLAVPILLRGEVIGVLEVVNKRSGGFDQDDRFLVETLAASAAVALDNARLVEQLRDQTDELQTRNEELDAFAHTVAHDLKGPIGVIIGFSEALEENLEAIPPEDVLRYLRTITRNGRRMNSIIKELLLMASVRTTQLKIAPVDTAAVVKEALDRLAYITDNKQVEIVQPKSWPVALGYEPWIEEVWVNYISNAIKYGGDPPRVELGATKQPDGSVRFWTLDNGPGIEAEDRERLFIPFSQLQPIRAQGHGLGLSIVRRIVEKLGGSVGVDSQAGQGSVFFFTLPGPSAPSLGRDD